MEYDLYIALEGMEKTETDRYSMRLPRSAVLFIRHNKNTPDKVTVELVNGKGEKLNHEITSIKLGSYLPEEMFRKKLLILFPFYIVNYEREIYSHDWNEEKQTELLKNYEEMINKLIETTKAWEDPEAITNSLLGAAKTVADHILRKVPGLKERMVKTMGGEILDDPFLKLKINYNRLLSKNRETEAKYEWMEAQYQDAVDEVHRLTTLLKEHGIKTDKN